MKCFHCGGDIPSTNLADVERDVFRCPHCDASHVRRLADHAPDGRPLYEVRLWGHPATTRRIRRIEGGRPTAVCP